MGAGLGAAAVLAHAQHFHAPSGGFPQATMSRAFRGGDARFDGLRANVGGGGLREERMRAGGPGRYGGASPYEVWRFETHYGGGITPVSADARQVPRSPPDSQLRAGSIREDVARYNEERAAFRPLARGSADVPRPPMPSPYRN